MSTAIRKYPSRTVINPGLVEYYSIQNFNNPTGSNGLIPNLNISTASTAIPSYDVIKVTTLVQWSLATGAQFDDIIISLLDGYTSRVYRRWSVASGFTGFIGPFTPTSPVNNYAILYFTIKDPPIFPANLWTIFTVVNPVYPSGTTSTFTFRNWISVTQSP